MPLIACMELVNLGKDEKVTCLGLDQLSGPLDLERNKTAYFLLSENKQELHMTCCQL